MTPSLEWQVTSLELSKRLKKLKVPQESVFYWYFVPAGGKPKDTSFQEIQRPAESQLEEFKDKYFSAFTSAELGEILKPIYIDFAWSELAEIWLVSLHKKIDNAWKVKIEHTEEATNLAECMGLMLEYLLKNGLLNL